MANKPTWRIYYGDGSTYDGSLEEAPPVDVQIIIIKDNNN